MRYRVRFWSHCVFDIGLPEIIVGESVYRWKWWARWNEFSFNATPQFSPFFMWAEMTPVIPVVVNGETTWVEMEKHSTQPTAPKGSP